MLLARIGSAIASYWNETNEENDAMAAKIQSGINGSI